jgi:uncharacterized protein (DUF697 family)
MSQHLSHGRAHLATNRRMILARSLGAAVAGAVPVPVLDDWLASRVRRGTVRRIAALRGVDLDDDAVIAIADGPEEPPSWSRIAGVTFLIKALSRSWRKVLITYVASQRARAAADTFTIATLFDHYCARLHVGLGLNGQSGQQLRRLISATMANGDGGLAAIMFKTGIIAAARATVRAPAELLDLVSGGRFRKLLRRGDEVEAVAEIDSAIARSMEGETGFLNNAITAIEAQLSSESNPYLDELLTRFETRWRQHREREHG